MTRPGIDPRACDACPVGAATCLGWDDRSLCAGIIEAWATNGPGGFPPYEAPPGTLHGVKPHLSFDQLAERRRNPP